MTDYSLHEYCSLFPVASDADANMLIDDIRGHGLLDAITLYQDKILDGRNRYTACRILNIEPRFVQFGGDDEAALEYVISKNLARRHLNESQRAMVGARLSNMQNGGDRRSDQSANLQTVSQSAAAHRVSVSTRSVSSARRVIDDGIPELSDAVEHGDIPVSVAAEAAELPHEIQHKIIQSENKKDAAKKYIAQQKRPEEHLTRQLRALRKAWDDADSDARARFLEGIGVINFAGVEL